MDSFTTLTSRVVPLLIDHVDTDQIIPARYLTVTGKEGLADGLFADWRRDPDFVLLQPQHAGAQVLLAGHNFGCGSSREHAPWALLLGGFRTIVSTGFADIFRANAERNGLLPVTVTADVHTALRTALEADPALEVTIDLATQALTWPGGAARFPIDPFARDCLLRGVDPLGYLLGLDGELTAFEARHEVGG